MVVADGEQAVSLEAAWHLFTDGASRALAADRCWSVSVDRRVGCRPPCEYRSRRWHNSRSYLLARLRPRYAVLLVRLGSCLNDEVLDCQQVVLTGPRKTATKRRIRESAAKCGVLAKQIDGSSGGRAVARRER